LEQEIPVEVFHGGSQCQRQDWQQENADEGDRVNTSGQWHEPDVEGIGFNSGRVDGGSRDVRARNPLPDEP